LPNGDAVDRRATRIRAIDEDAIAISQSGKHRVTLHPEGDNSAARARVTLLSQAGSGTLWEKAPSFSAKFP